MALNPSELFGGESPHVPSTPPLARGYLGIDGSTQATRRYVLISDKQERLFDVPPSGLRFFQSDSDGEIVGPALPANDVMVDAREGRVVLVNENLNAAGLRWHLYEPCGRAQDARRVTKHELYGAREGILTFECFYCEREETLTLVAGQTIISSWPPVPTGWIMAQDPVMLKWCSEECERAERVAWLKAKAWAVENGYDSAPGCITDEEKQRFEAIRQDVIAARKRLSDRKGREDYRQRVLEGR